MTDKERLDWLETLLHKGGFCFDYHESPWLLKDGTKDPSHSDQVEGFSCPSQHVNLPPTATVRDLIDEMKSQAEGNEYCYIWRGNEWKREKKVIKE